MHKKVNITQFNWISKVKLRISSNKIQFLIFSGKWIMNIILNVYYLLLTLLIASNYVSKR